MMLMAFEVRSATNSSLGQQMAVSQTGNPLQMGMGARLMDVRLKNEHSNHREKKKTGNN